MNFSVGVFVGFMAALILVLSLRAMTGASDANAWAYVYAARTCEHGHEWENDMLYCLDENGNWIKQ